MEDELTITNPALDLTPTEEAPATAPRLRARWQAIDEERRMGIIAFALAVSIVGGLASLVYGAVAVWQHNARTQAIQRARKMDGSIYTIKNAGWTFLGDTRLYLVDERGADAGWIAMHMNNPFTSEVHPLFLTMAGRGNEPPSFPMKVRVHFRPSAWTDEHVSDPHENYTASFLTFEKLDK